MSHVLIFTSIYGTKRWNYTRSWWIYSEWWIFVYRPKIMHSKNIS